MNFIDALHDFLKAFAYKFFDALHDFFWKALLVQDYASVEFSSIDFENINFVIFLYFLIFYFFFFFFLVCVKLKSEFGKKIGTSIFLHL
jgi:hypothetical protein